MYRSRSCLPTLSSRHQVLDVLVSELSSHMILLQRLVDNVALLDLLQAFAKAVSEAPGSYCRPQLYEEGPLAIVQV